MGERVLGAQVLKFFVVNILDMPSKVELPTYQFGAATKQKKTPRRSKTKRKSRARKAGTRKKSQKRGQGKR